jgi:plasmid stabilization system protein ParE
MKIELTIDFQFDLQELVEFIAKDKPIAARRFKKNLLINLKKDLKNPYSFKKSIYFDDDNHRDYVFKVYTVVYEINLKKDLIFILGLLKLKKTF